MTKPRPDGVWHARLTLVITPLAAGVGLLTGGLLPAVCAGLGCLAGVVLSPDLDQQGITYSEWIWTKIPLVGWLLTGVWFIIWLPYSFGMRHRGLSHTPVIGTLTRLVYLGVWVVPIWLWRGLPTPTLEQLGLLGYAALGLALSDVGHWGRDHYGWQL